MKRCGTCENCLKVETVRTSVLKAMNDTAVKKPHLRGETAEDARIIWNSTLQDFPCTSPQDDCPLCEAGMKAEPTKGVAATVTNLETGKDQKVILPRATYNRILALVKTMKPVRKSKKTENFQKVKS